MGPFTLQSIFKFGKRPHVDIPDILDVKEFLSKHVVHVEQFTDIRHFRFKACPTDPSVVCMSWRLTSEHPDWEGNIKFFADGKKVDCGGLLDALASSGEVLVGLHICFIFFAEGLTCLFIEKQYTDKKGRAEIYDKVDNVMELLTNTLRFEPYQVCSDFQLHHFFFLVKLVLASPHCLSGGSCWTLLEHCPETKPHGKKEPLQVMAILSHRWQDYRTCTSQHRKHWSSKKCGQLRNWMSN